MSPPRSAQHQAVATQIAAGVQADMASLLDRVVRRIRREVPSYGRTDIVGIDELRSSVADNVDHIIKGLTGADPSDLRAPRATGRARAAQGAPLVEMLSAYRVGFAEVCSGLVATARALPGAPDDVLVALGGPLFALFNEYCDAAIVAYRDEAQQMVRAHERERAVLVEAILTGPAGAGPLWDVAHALRLPLDGAFMIVAARADLGHDPMPRVESALAVHDIRSVWRLETDLGIGVLSLTDRSREQSALAVLDKHAGGPVGVSPVFGELSQAAWGLRLARLALEGRPDGGVGVEQFRDRPLNFLLAAAPHAALETARVVLGGLLALPPDDRDLLLTTFETWVDAGGSAQEASTVLFCHPNTVRYRLRRLESETGRRMTHPADAAELVAAARAWSQLPHSTTDLGSR
ncbi:PucR-like helix-turn-helix protein [Pseudonocardia sediminis]|uniref:PucR-like helix-turn-helix protein n=1 Tax=Pseudonocardia sediminis TaxID=1397368 RepID=A0A4Q7UVD0_PSEST|nr:helix-turn-helix domain-containing protein [Pseudonocardia sediminis]RZT85937.1 PucR-like helix-turn-helix protein [Pseudonocardia sediminis]